MEFVKQVLEGNILSEGQKDEFKKLNNIQHIESCERCGKKFKSHKAVLAIKHKTIHAVNCEGV